MESFPVALYDALLLDLEKVVDAATLAKGELYPGCDSRSAACIMQAKNFLRKFEASSEKADANAIGKFLSVNERMASYIPESTSWESPIQYVFDDMVFSFERMFYRGAQCKLNQSSILSGLNTGPGASIGASGDSFYQKIGASRLTATNQGLIRIFRSWASNLPLWNDAIVLSIKHFGEPKVVEGSKLSCVPKNIEISRTICTEPLLNMMFQKGIGKVLEDLLNFEFGIKFSKTESADRPFPIQPEVLLQPDKNRELARIGSIDNSFATIDLSSASDSISQSLLQRLLPKEVNSWLQFTRSPVTTVGSTVVPLHMVSSMGNGFTFPLQTLIFATLVRSVYRLLDLPLVFPRGNSIGNFGVFGDDIIVVREAAPLVLKCLDAFGFIPNVEKTFIDGDFKESCGHDYLDGINIRSVFLRKMDSLQDRYVIFNRLVEWSASHGVPLHHVLDLIKDRLGKKFTAVPLWENDDAGIRIPWPLASQFGGVACINQRTQSFCFKYRSYKPRGLYIRFGDSSVHLANESILWNPAAAMLSLLRGDLRTDAIAIRRRLSRYENCVNIVPGWNHDFRMAGYGLHNRDLAAHGRAVENHLLK